MNEGMLTKIVKSWTPPESETQEKPTNCRDNIESYE